MIYDPKEVIITINGAHINGFSMESKINMPRMKILGITGTRRGLSEAQREKLELILPQLRFYFDTFNHGDCIGVDKQVAIMCESLNYFTISHPPKIGR